MEEQANEVEVEQAVVENADSTAAVEQVTVDTQEQVVDTQEQTVQDSQEAVANTQEQAADSQEQAVAETQDTAADTQVQPTQDEAQVSDDKKKKKRDKKPSKPSEDKAKKEPKVGLYITSLFKYFNIITLLPFALLMYAVFFSSSIVDKGDLFKSNVVWICIIMVVAAAVMIAWFIVTLKKRRVCSLDAFLLMALLICVSMIIQCIIFKNFATFDGVAIITLVATVAVLALLTVRLILFKPSEQRKNDDAKYTAKNKASMYFKVIFAKYGFFVAMLCVIGALLILILTQSNIFEDFSIVASQTEQIVTMLFAGIAAVLMIVGIFIRIVRGRANVIDCMPYMLFLVGLGGIIYFIMRHTYQILYIAIGALVVGALWLFLCEYTLLMSNYKKVEQQSAEGTAETQGTDTQESVAESQPAADVTIDDTVVVDAATEPTPTADVTSDTAMADATSEPTTDTPQA